MTGMIQRALTLFAALAIGASPAAAQQLIHAEASSGGMFTTIAPAAGVYADGAWALLPTTSAVGEVQFGWNSAEVVGLGGVRQQFFRSSKGDIYGQLLLGFATGHSPRCDLCQARVTEFGVGANVALNDRWAVRVRADMRVGGGAADLPFPTLGAGITRTWGAR
jgi:hypothetical protein